MSDPLVWGVAVLMGLFPLSLLANIVCHDFRAYPYWMIIVMPSGNHRGYFGHWTRAGAQRHADRYARKYPEHTFAVVERSQVPEPQ